MLDLVKERFEFSYESDAASSYLVISLKDHEKIIDHQIEMIANNPISSILSFNVRRKDDKVNLYYNITSKQSLLHFLGRKKLKRNEFIKILKNITSTFLECKNYFLLDKSFLLLEEYIYISPVSLETSLAYVPVIIDQDFLMNFKGFITNLIVNLAHFDEDCNDNFLQRILNYIKNDTFNAAGLDKLLAELKDGVVPDIRKIHDIQPELIQPVLNISQGAKISIPQSAVQSVQKQEVRKLEKRESYLQEPLKKQPIRNNVTLEPDRNNVVQEKTKMRYKSNIIIIAVLTQILIIIAIIVLYQAVASQQQMDSTAIFGLFLVAGVIDFLVLRKLFDKKNMETVTAVSKDNASTNKERKELVQPQRPVYEQQNINMSKRESYNQPVVPADRKMIKDSLGGGIAEAVSTSQNTEIIFDKNMDDTMVLGHSQEKKPYLKNVRDGVIEKISITKNNFLIGRLTGQVDYVSKNNAVGKMHAEIICRDGEYYIKDLNSRNGTYINGEKISSNIEYKIENKDEIDFANGKYTFFIS